MRSRILIAILAVSGTAILLFGIPLAVVIDHAYHQQAMRQLAAEATGAATDVPSNFTASADAIELPVPPDSSRLGLYLPDGRKVNGAGPAVADDSVRQALAGRIGEASSGGYLVVAVPLTDEERVYAAVRASLPDSAVAGPVHGMWLVMVLAGLGTLVVAAAVAGAVAGRLSKPIGHLVTAAARLGEGDFSTPSYRSGVAELDAAHRALTVTARRLAGLLARERAFNTRASHQLRTPLTALRLRLEAAQMTSPSDLGAAVGEAVVQVDRLQSIVDDLLELARDRPARERVDIQALLDEAERTWHGPLAASNRPLRVVVEDDLPDVRASAAAVRQILNVLMDNALRHGRGTVGLRARAGGRGLVLEVSDEGGGLPSGAGHLLTSSPEDSPTGPGIGLPLARSLAEAEGGRLMLRPGGGATVFQLFLPPQPGA